MADIMNDSLRNRAIMLTGINPGVRPLPYAPKLNAPSPIAAPFLRTPINQTFGGFQQMPTTPGMFDVPEAGKGIGDRIKGAVDWLTDGDKGLARQALILQGIGTIADIYAANRQGKQEDEDRERRRSRHGAVAQGYGRILQDLAR